MSSATPGGRGTEPLRRRGGPIKAANPDTIFYAGYEIEAPSSGGTGRGWRDRAYVGQRRRLPGRHNRRIQRHNAEGMYVSAFAPTHAVSPPTLSGSRLIRRLVSQPGHLLGQRLCGVAGPRQKVCARPIRLIRHASPMHCAATLSPRPCCKTSASSRMAI